MTSGQVIHRNSSVVFSLPREMLDYIARIKKDNTPNESVAFIFGTFDDFQGRVYFNAKKIRELKNVGQSPSYFEIDPFEHYKVLMEEQKNDLRLVAILHTHPGNQFVSPTDEQYMKNLSKFTKTCWLIAGEKEGVLDLGGYIFIEGKIFEVPINVR
ncbi:MAG: Mov34/MPN/PAD-1 family protein [Promethearchaeota archaeon]